MVKHCRPMWVYISEKKKALWQTKLYKTNKHVQNITMVILVNSSKEVSSLLEWDDSCHAEWQISLAELMTLEGFDWSTKWLIIKLQSIFDCSFISPLNNNVPGCQRCMAKCEATAKNTFTAPVCDADGFSMISHDAKESSAWSVY